VLSDEESSDGDSDGDGSFDGKSAAAEVHLGSGLLSVSLEDGCVSRQQDAAGCNVLGHGSSVLSDRPVSFVPWKNGHLRMQYGFDERRLSSGGKPWRGPLLPARVSPKISLGDVWVRDC
jgi:hypothetical protein